MKDTINGIEGYWCQGACVFIQQSEGVLAVEEYRRKLSKGAIGISSHYPHGIRCNKAENRSARAERLLREIEELIGNCDSIRTEKIAGFISEWRASQ